MRKLEYVVPAKNNKLSVGADVILFIAETRWYVVFWHWFLQRPLGTRTVITKVTDRDDETFTVEF